MLWYKICFSKGKKHCILVPKNSMFLILRSYSFPKKNVPKKVIKWLWIALKIIKVYISLYYYIWLYICIHSSEVAYNKLCAQNLPGWGGEMDESMPGVFNILPGEKKQVLPATSICHICRQTLCTINFSPEWIAQIYMESVPWLEEESLGVTAFPTEVYFLLPSFRTRIILILSTQRQVWSCP